MEVTLELPDEVYRQAESLARRSSRNVADVLSETLRLKFSGEIGWSLESDLPPLTDLADDEVLALSESRMDLFRDERLSALLKRQGEGNLSAPDRYELADLMRIYQEGLLRKSRAAQEAARRGLKKIDD